ncbi:HTH-type transcriptional repressor Bm3R1 [Desulfosporosinus acididurans]|uniref:HTH-type transcriptional repressor Bm3R1 n=1 Tax=Desulfosporosinus acididurans TaxID=476652 RepID=A0A0J1FLE9_9FIRM|nr:TetR/AcrR family transcriptional regulator [Desulfosporosinus acididurans]KLU63763.1 HTH-type transcriptional repressor Bm3R1 [Desulfosporosinus acididurans]
MARPRSEDKRSAIMSAAIHVIASQGLGAPTATIAKEAGVSNGSLFNYFGTKADLLNQLYIELKSEMAAAALDGLPSEDDIRRQMLHVWSQWLSWATSFPEKRRALTHLGVLDDITVESRQIANNALSGISKLLERGRENGPMCNTPLEFIVSIVNAMADATIDFMINDPANADKHCTVSFDAIRRMLT